MCSRSSVPLHCKWRTWGLSPSPQWPWTRVERMTEVTNTHHRCRTPSSTMSISTIWAAITSSRHGLRTQIYCHRTTAYQQSKQWIMREASASGSHTLRKVRSVDLSRKRVIKWSDFTNKAGVTWIESMALRIAAALSRTLSIATEHKINLRQESIKIFSPFSLFIN